MQCVTWGRKRTSLLFRSVSGVGFPLLLWWGCHFFSFFSFFWGKATPPLTVEEASKARQRTMRWGDRHKTSPGRRKAHAMHPCHKYACAGGPRGHNKPPREPRPYTAVRNDGEGPAQARGRTVAPVLGSEPPAWSPPPSPRGLSPRTQDFEHVTCRNIKTVHTII